MRYDVALAACKSYEDAEVSAALETAVTAAGGLDWVTPGMRVALKLNLVSAMKPEEAATVHPAVVCALVRMLQARGAHVVLGDSPGGLYNAAHLQRVYDVTGLRAAEALGAELNGDFSVCSVSYPEAVQARSFTETAYLRNADAIIDVCKLKTHGMMGMTNAVKNFFGIIPGTMKPEYHYKYPQISDFSNMLIDLSTYFKPRICICDAVVGMEGNGPTAGQNRHIGLVMASENAHALDLASCYLIDYAPNEVDTVREAIERGLVCDSAEKIDIAGEDIKPLVMKDYLKPESHFNLIKLISLPDALNARLINALASKPAMDYDICVGCGECARCCPPKAIDMSSGKPVIDTKRCIKCFCCQELCPKKAVKIKRPLLNRFMIKFLK
mgnify:FL=1